MYTDQKVQITKVANGYMVNIKPEKDGEPPSFVMELIEKLPAILGKIFTGANKDGDEEEDMTLSEIRHKQAAEILESAGESNIFIFKTWKELAGFLQLHFEK